MHVYWTGVAADLLRSGDTSCRWMLEKAAEGEIFAAIHGEAGNDIPLLLSSAKAEKVAGRLGDHRPQDLRQPLARVDPRRLPRDGHLRSRRTRKIVHGFLPRNTTGYEIVETWDTLGMRATQSHDTVLDRAFVADENIVLVCPAGFAGAGPVPGQQSSPGR